MTPPAASQTTPRWQDRERQLRRAGHRITSLRPLSGDVSRRAYARVEGASGPSRILASYPADMRDVVDRFLTTTTLFERADIRVPRVLDVSRSEGWMLLEDVGDQSLYSAHLAGERRIADRIKQASRLIAKIQAIDAGEVRALNAPPLDADLLWAECRSTFESLPTGVLSDENTAELEERLRALCSELGAAKSGPCHRDFMARNLMLFEEGLVVIDHQDLRIGPRSYDLSSLLNDSVQTPREQTSSFLLESAVSPDDYHRAVVQRMFKIVGTFLRFAALGEPRHLALVPNALRRLLHSLAQLTAPARLVGDLRDSFEGWIDRGIGP